jgi:undecaprenyl-diphosphatase
MSAGAHPPESPALEPGSAPFISAALGLGLLAASLALGGFVWLGYQVRSGGPTALDLAGRAWVRSLETPSLSDLLWGASVYGAPVRKTLFARTRPQAFFDYYPAPESYSFPSGHALFATCFFGGIAVLMAHRVESRTGQVLIWLVALILIFLISVSRVYLGVHYPTDVIAGFAVGVIWVAAVALGDRLAEHGHLRV